MTLAAVSLDDKYTLERGRVFLNGTQALARLCLMQRLRDARAGLDTAGYVTGYRGSPLGSVDKEFWRAERFLAAQRIRFQPAVNEDLAATAVWGTQQIGLAPGARHDGVFAIWYGKGPGVDRTGDVFRHANLAGTAPNGGVLALAGDDPGCKSSTVPSASEFALMDAQMPFFHPANAQEILDLGLIGWALSRYSGCWVGMKMVSDNVDTSAALSIDPERIAIRLPDDFEMPPGGLHIRWPDPPMAQEERLARFKIPAVRAFARANRIDRIALDAPSARFGIVGVGKAYLDVRQALADLGIDAAALGVRVMEVRMPWPLEPEGIRDFARGLREILVVEEKRALVETQIKEILYGAPADARPHVLGKCDESGAPLLPIVGELSPADAARAIASRLGRLPGAEAVRERARAIEESGRRAVARAPDTRRIPYFCAGCPHNTSTKVPDGSRAVAGIGCHYMAIWMDRQTATFTHMGGEGANWIGQAPFVETPHVFVNLGDGTYFHSGLLAIRAAVAAGVNITYKILYNDAVAMTGGQPMDGPLDVAMITRQVAAEGVARVVVVAEEPERWRGSGALAPGTAVFHRDEIDGVQRDLRAWRGVTVLVYDQTCAAEKRRRRKRGLMPDPDERVFINQAVCEGCGDCGVQSNCVAIVPVETELGRKRAIDQSACNKDFSCLKGFCPSFVTVRGGAPQKRRGIGERPFPALPEPAVAAAGADRACNLIVSGIGGTGVVTVGALLGMAAHLEGKAVSVLDVAGLAQKNGEVYSHIRIAGRADDLFAPRLGPGGADVVLGCDLVTAASAETLPKCAPARTRAVVNTHETMTATFTRRPDEAFPEQALVQAIRAATEAAHLIDATGLATALLGDSIAANVFLLGFASQKGLLPVSAEAIGRAIELNGVAVRFNLDAFLWGRRTAHDPAAVARLLPAPAAPADGGLDGFVDRRAADLLAYQDAALAARYRDLVEKTRAAEQARAPGRDALAWTVARGYFKLLAYKDEYEVARLYADGAFARDLRRTFGPSAALTFHLAPPALAERDPVSGELKKRAFGPWVMTAFRVLRRLKFLRGTAFDPFGRSEERRTERRLIGEYEATVAELIARLDSDNHALAVEIAGLPTKMRGFGHVKARAVAAAKAREAELLTLWRAGAARAGAAE